MEQLTHPRSLRSCILFQFLRGKPFTETYHNFCEVMGYEAIKFKEFEIWYYRFSRGEFELDYDDRSEPKTVDFCQLPTCVIEKVLKKLCYKEQLTVRKVCRDLKSVVDSMRFSLKSIKMVWHSDHIECRFDNQLVVYSRRNSSAQSASIGTSLRESIKIDDDDIIRVVDNDYKKLALQDWKFPMNNQKLRLDGLGIQCKEPNNEMNEDTKVEKLGEFFTELREALDSIHIRIHARVLQIYSFHPNFNHIECILSHLEPGFLFAIQIPDFKLKHDELNVTLPIDSSDEAYETAVSNFLKACSIKRKISKITSLEQWKRAEWLWLYFNWDYISDKDLIHFKRFYLERCNIERERLLHLKEIFSKSINFEECIMHKSPDLRNASHHLESFCEKEESENPNILFYHYKIPNSNKYLVFKVDYNEGGLIIKKR
ncbi:hypothetical protein CRE_19729 [Caenorhabditis remanei]|uniref:F-box domain-containing protein n=1 Tax=Caenorhabditis remanei TaxID=31234 RepID=E3MTH8_CAERE|nr:hypothetical protein CRE_19729 [Caenorhabditis remanei]